jgi:nucleoside-diphosphate-sugar epimerase
VRVLLPEGTGFIGYYVAELLLERGDEVAVVDGLSTGKRENVPEGAQVYEVDVRSAGVSPRSSGGSALRSSAIRRPRWTFGAPSGSRTSTPG